MDRFVIRKRPAPPEEEHETSSDSGRSETHPVKQTLRKFRDDWLSRFSWLRNKDGCSYCIACDKKLSNHFSFLKKHNAFTIHQQNEQKKKHQIQMDKFLDEEHQQMSKQTRHAELTLVMFLICHNLPFLLMDFLPKLLKECCPDSRIAQQLHCGRTKATELVDQLGKRSCEEITEKLRTNKFSLIVDETTDVSTNKCLILIVRFFDKFSRSVHDKFLGLIELKYCDANSIYLDIKKFFMQRNIPLKNVIGLATDGANVMAGELNSLKEKLKSDVDLFFIKCTCHSLHLCSAYACKQLPHQIEQLCRSIYSFFSHSPKRIEELKEFQEYCQVEPHKILGVSLTRWLALEQVINRIVEQWLPLYLYFLDRVLEVNGTKASDLALQMNEPDVKVYFLFLSYILKIINDMNKEFQSEKVRLPYLHLHLESNFKLILVNFMSNAYVRNLKSLNNIDLLDEGNYVQIENVFIGSKAEDYLKKSILTDFQKVRIKRNVLKFYIELLKQIKQRFDFSREDVKNLVIITPGKVLSNSELSIEPLLKNFPGLATSDPEIIVSQWKLLRLTNLELNTEMNILDFWEKISVFKNGMGEACFQDLTNFVYNLMTLPHSSAAAERKFSDLSLIKSKTRNKLSYKTINNIMLAKELANSQNKANYVWAAKHYFK